MNEWNKNELEEFLQQSGSGLIYLYTPFCGTCQVASKMLSVAAEVLPEVTVGKINLNYMSELAKAWEVESVPCLVFIHRGNITDKMYAFQSVPDLVQKIQTFIALKDGESSRC